jgi:hypothetical protein
MSESTAVISLEEQLKQRLALQSKTLSDMSGGQNFISFKGGNIIVDNQVVPNGEMDVVILSICNERTYYAGEYDPNKTQVPACYSYNGQLPHPEASEPQHENCRGCPHDKWGSAVRGKGKACREAARLALISANADPAEAVIYSAKVPITSIGTVKELTAKAGMAGKLVAQYVTRLVVKPDDKTFFKVTLMAIGENKTDLTILLDRIQEADKIVNRPYPVFEEAEEVVPQKPIGKDGKAKY